MMVTAIRWALPLAASSSTPNARGPLLVGGRFAYWPAARLSNARAAAPKLTACDILRYNGELYRRRKAPMEINDKAPEFSSLDQNGEKIALKDFKGKWVVLYFYPRADTPGCTIEACSFRDSFK